jgi:natural resistance-associated macrophage protein
VKEANFYYAIESCIALFVSFVVNLFVVSVFAAGFYGSDDAGDIGLSQAGNKLRDKYGDVAFYVWAIGLLAAGQSSTMTGTYAGQFVMQGFLNLTIAPWKRVLITRLVAIVPAIVVALVATNNLDFLDELLNVVQSIQLPFALLPALKFTTTENIMGIFKNSMTTTFILWALAFMIIAFNAYLVGQHLVGAHVALWVLCGLVSLAYFCFLGYIANYCKSTFFNLSSKCTFLNSFFEKN